MDEKISVLQFKTNGEWGVLEIRNTLGALQEAVGGYIDWFPSKREAYAKIKEVKGASR